MNHFDNFRGAKSNRFSLYQKEDMTRFFLRQADLVSRDAWLYDQLAVLRQDESSGIIPIILKPVYITEAITYRKRSAATAQKHARRPHTNASPREPNSVLRAMCKPAGVYIVPPWSFRLQHKT